MKIFGCHGNELPIKEILYQSVFGDKYYMIGHKFTISVTMDVSPFAWCLARAVLNSLWTRNPKTVTLTNSEDPDEMPPNAAFHQGLHCLRRQNRSSEQEIHLEHI